MALGRAEKLFTETGKPVAICDDYGYARKHDAWLFNPAVDPRSTQKIVDCPGNRPYIAAYKNGRMFYNEDYRAQAGRIHLTDVERASNTIQGRYAVVGPTVKGTASPNKDWGIERWEEVIKDFPIPVYQLCENPNIKTIRGALRRDTPTFREAYAVIERAALVMCNEGGNHHMAASAKVPAVVVFGAFISPSVTGYEFHQNLAADTDEGFCGNWKPCEHCKEALASIKPSVVRRKAMRILDSVDAEN